MIHKLASRDFAAAAKKPDRLSPSSRARLSMRATRCSSIEMLRRLARPGSSTSTAATSAALAKSSENSESDLRCVKLPDFGHGEAFVRHGFDMTG